MPGCLRLIQVESFNLSLDVEYTKKLIVGRNVCCVVACEQISKHLLPPGFDHNSSGCALSTSQMKLTARTDKLVHAVQCTRNARMKGDVLSARTYSGTYRGGTKSHSTAAF